MRYSDSEPFLFAIFRLFRNYSAVFYSLICFFFGGGGGGGDSGDNGLNTPQNWSF